MTNNMLIKKMKPLNNLKTNWIKIIKRVVIFIPSHGIVYDMAESIFLFTPCFVSSRSDHSLFSRSCSNGFSSLQVYLRTSKADKTDCFPFYIQTMHYTNLYLEHFLHCVICCHPHGSTGSHVCEVSYCCSVYAHRQNFCFFPSRHKDSTMSYYL